MADEARLNEILDIAEQAKREGDEATFNEMMALFDQESAQPSAPAAPAAAPKAPQPQISNNPLEVLGGGLDAAATLVSGAIATPISGLVGMAAAPFVEDPVALIEDIQAILTHDAMSESGQRMLQVAGAPFQKLAQGADAAGDFVLDKTNSPLLATAARTFIEGAPDIIGLKGARAAGVAAKNTRRMAPQGTDQALLQRAGVDLKRSDMGGNRWKDIDRVSEDVLGSSSMDVRQAQQFNRAVLDRADPQGTATAGKVKVSPDVLKDLGDDISKSYNDLHSRRDTPVDSQFEADMDQILIQAELDLAPDQLAQLRSKVKEIRDKSALHGGSIPGKAGQNIRTRIGKLTQVNDPFMPGFARELRDAMDAAWERAAPQADKLKMAETRARWRMHDQLEKTMRGNASGNVSPSKLYSVADRGSGRTAGLHDLASAGRNVLVDGLGNSGTAPRAANIGKMVGLVNKPGELARTLAGVAGGRFLNESPNLGAKAGVLARQRSPQLVAAGSMGEAALAAEDRRTQEFLRALGL